MVTHNLYRQHQHSRHWTTIRGSTRVEVDVASLQSIFANTVSDKKVSIDVSLWEGGQYLMCQWLGFSILSLAMALRAPIFQASNKDNIYRAKVVASLNFQKIGCYRLQLCLCIVSRVCSILRELDEVSYLLKYLRVLGKVF